MKLTACIFALLLIGSCASNATKPEICDSELSHSTIENQLFKVYIYNPNVSLNPDIWEGPICVQRRSDNSTCHFSQSLIKLIEFQNSEELSITVFSGSNSTSWSLNLNTCKAKMF